MKKERKTRSNAGFPVPCGFQVPYPPAIEKPPFFYLLLRFFAMLNSSLAF